MQPILNTIWRIWEFIPEFFPNCEFLYSLAAWST